MLRAWSFLTPFGGASEPDAKTLRWFPLVGAAIGVLVGLVWWGATHAWHGSVVPAGLAVLADLVLTGMLHLDGLADSADGLLPHLDRQRRLAVMAQPDVGAFGVGIVAIVLLLRFAAFVSLDCRVLLVGGVWCASRSAMALATAVLPYARAEGGLASSFLGDGRSTVLVVGALGVVVGGALAAGVVGWRGVAAVAAVVLAAAGVLALARARLGGFTGDVLGAAGVLGETAALLVAAAKW